MDELGYPTLSGPRFEHSRDTATWVVLALGSQGPGSFCAGGNPRWAPARLEALALVEVLEWCRLCVRVDELRFNPQRPWNSELGAAP